MFIYSFKKGYIDKGMVICIALSLALLIFFFGKLLYHPNVTYFNVSGDGLQVYYNSLFHVFYDDEILNEKSMHYPYTESVFFTGCIPILTFLIKIFHLQQFTIGIINLFMLFSIPLSAFFLYLIFKEYKVNYLFAALSAVAIAYLSPQVCRMGAHYNLSYCFALPLTIWLMLNYSKSPSLKKSIIISAYCFFLASMHMYLFVFAAAIISFYWISVFFVLPIKMAIMSFIKHFFIQIILPFLLLQFLIYVGNGSGERTSFPWGFFVYYSNLNGVFYPFDRFYEPIFKWLGLSNDVSYEGISFVGLSAIVICVVLTIKLFTNIIKLKILSVFNLTGIPFLNSLLICGLLCLIFSFCIPFKDGYQDLVNKLGFLKQFRALGRFTWVFFYVINIVLIVVISNIKEKYNKFYFKSILMVLIIFTISYDAYCNIVNLQNQLNNKITALSDTYNKRMENFWVNNIKTSDYQAILPFPYFHFGSENLGILTQDQSLKNACLVSLKTGLPMISVYNSRVSLEQSYENIQLLKEPTGKIPKILNDFKNEKDILIVAINDQCSDLEKKILMYAKLIDVSDKFTLYRISFSDFKNYYTNFSKNIYEEFSKKHLFKCGQYLSTDSVQNFIVINHDSNKDAGCFDIGVKIGRAREYTIILDTILPSQIIDTGYVVSFWIKNLKKDLVSRTSIEINATRPDNSYYNILYSTINSHYVQIDNDWTLIEHKFRLEHINDRIRITLWNLDLNKNDTLIIDNILFKKISEDVYLNNGERLLKNNKVYYKTH